MLAIFWIKTLSFPANASALCCVQHATACAPQHFRPYQRIWEVRDLTRQRIDVRRFLERGEGSIHRSQASHFSLWVNQPFLFLTRSVLRSTTTFLTNRIFQSLAVLVESRKALYLLKED